MEEIKYPVRINRYLAQKKVCARREADELILHKKVKINGRIAILGDKVNEKDKVIVESLNKKLVYIVFNKPVGVITHEIDFDKNVFPVGRLDKDSSGLIILTNDGRVNNALLNPKHEHEKEYIVKVNKDIDNLFSKRMSDGIKLPDGYVTKKCVVEKISQDRFSIILTEGKKHQIRRMCDALGYGILTLERRRIMNIKLNNLVQGDYREIRGQELSEFLKSIEL